MLELDPFLQSDESESDRIIPPSALPLLRAFQALAWLPGSPHSPFLPSSQAPLTIQDCWVEVLYIFKIAITYGSFLEIPDL
jgi:hypothetical protein